MPCYIMEDDVLLPHVTVHEAKKVFATLKVVEKMIVKINLVIEIWPALGLLECLRTVAGQSAGVLPD